MESKLYRQVEESEPRNKLFLIDLDDKSIRGSSGDIPLVAGHSPRRRGGEPKGRA